MRFSQSIRSKQFRALSIRGAAVAAGVLFYACNGTEITGPTKALSVKGLTAAHQFGTGTPVDSKIDVTIFMDQGSPIPMPGEPGDPPPIVDPNGVLAGTPLIARIHVNALDDGHGLAGPIGASQGDPNGVIAHTYDLVSNEQGIVDVPFVAETPTGTWAFNASFGGSERNGFSYQPSNTSTGYNVFVKCPKGGCGSSGPVATRTDAAVFLDLGVPLPPPGQGFPVENLLPPNGVVPNTPLFVRIHVQAQDGTFAGVAGPVVLTIYNPDGSQLALFDNLQTSPDGGVVDVQITSTLPVGSYRVHVDFLGSAFSKLVSYSPSSGDSFFQVYVPNKPPVARTTGDITVTANLPGNPSPVARATLDGSASSDSDGQIVEYSWYEDFAGGGSAPVGSGSITNNIFSVGDHTIRLHVRDNQNATAEATFILHVLPNAPPVARPGPDITVTANGSGTGFVTLNGTASSDPDGTIVEYSWFEDFPNGTSAPRGAGPTVGQVFPVGDHTVRLHVRDNVNQTNDATFIVHVLPNQPPISRPGSDQTVTATGPGGANVVLDGSASTDPDGNINQYQWFEDVGPGNVIPIGNGPHIQHFFSVGDHHVRLRVTDNANLSNDASITIHVLPGQPPIANAGGDRTVIAMSPGGAQVTLDGTASSSPNGQIVFYGWFEDFANGTSSQFAGGPTVSTLFPVGDHHIRLVVRDNTNQQAQTSITVHVLANTPPVARPGSDQTVIAQDGSGVVVTLDGSASSDPDGTIVGYSWSEDLPGGGSFGLGAGPVVHPLLAVGDHHVVLHVRDNGGLMTDGHVTIHVIANTPPVARAGSDQTVFRTSAAGANVFLNGSASSDADGTIVEYLWLEAASPNDPDVTLGTSATLTHQFSLGDHIVRLKVKDNGGLTNVAFVTIHVLNVAPTAIAAISGSRTLECVAGGAIANLDGTGSHDADGFIASYAWTSTAGGASGAITSLHVPMGTTTFGLQVTDNDGATANASTSVNVVDTQSPTISGNFDVTTLWPPSHKLVKVASGVTASDACSGAGNTVGISVTSNEPLNGTGDGNTSSDWNIVRNSDGTYDVYVRSERSGNLNDRIYTITVSATDASGNVRTMASTVTVPHNK